MADKKPELIFSLLVPHPSETRLLAFAGGGSWHLPAMEPEEWFGFDKILPVTGWVRETLGMNAVVLRCIRSRFDQSANRLNRLYEMENLDPGWAIPAGARWLGPDELDEISLPTPEHRVLLEDWFREVEQGVPPERRPWARKGWFQNASAWVNGQLHNLGYEVQNIELFRSWGISAILRTATKSGYFYFKAVPPMFANEVRITQTLSGLFPRNTPRTVAAELEQNWMLMPDFGGTLLCDTEEVEKWEEAVAMLSRMQLECVPLVETLLSSGFRDRRLVKFPAMIEDLFASPESLRTGHPTDLSDEEFRRIMAQVPRYLNLCEELASLGIPETLEHGDYHANNVVVREDGYLVYDWTDAAVSHPFLSLLTLLEFEDYMVSKPGVWDRLVRAYLQPWTTYAPIERLLEAYRFSEELAIINQLISYRWIIGNLELDTRWEQAESIPEFLRMLLARLPA